MSRTFNSSAWIGCSRPNPRARVRLFCFPYAGGASSIFRNWQDALPPGVEVCSIQLPGRGNRLMEPPFTSFSSLIEALTEGIRHSLDRPFAFFGHSLGALTAFELTRTLRQVSSSQPVCLFASGSPAPQIPRDAPLTFDLPEHEFIEELRRLNGTPPEVLAHPGLMELMLPVLRADFEAVQTYVYREGPPIDCRLAVFGGMEDHDITREELEAWRIQTTGRFKLKFLPGDHFFISTAQSLLLSSLSQELHEAMKF